MKVRAISERWTIIGVSILMVLALALLAHGLMRNKERARQLGMLALDRTVNGQRWRMDLLIKTFSWDLEREAGYASGQDHRSDTELLDHWLPLLQNRYPILGIGIANDRGDDRVLQRIDSIWSFTSTLRSAVPIKSTVAYWPMHRLDTVAMSPAQPGQDPRETIWFSQALEDRHDEPVWSVSEKGGSAVSPRNAMHLSLLIRGRTDSDAYRVIHFDIDAATMLGDLTRWTPEISTVLLSDKGRPLVPIDTSGIGSAWDGAIADWQQDRFTSEFHRTIGDDSWVGRIVPYDMNGAQLYIGVMISFDPIERWNDEGRMALWWVLGLLVLLAMLLVMVVMQSRNADKRVRRQERRSSVQARDLAQALGEREVLDREVHHRVKNNLQVVSSLLNLQSQRIKGEDVRAEFERGKRRIDAMALVHHKLYRQQDLSSVDLHMFMDDLAKAVSAMYEPGSRSVSHHVETNGLRADADTSIQLGMILCELLGNCFLHAFPHETVGHVEIRIRKMDEAVYVLTVKDNGNGMDEDTGPRAHLGLEIVAALADQLDGEMRIVNDEGTTVEVTFRMVQRRMLPGRNA